MLYAEDNRGHFSGRTRLQTGFVPTSFSDRSGTDDDANWLYPDFIKPLNSYICPGTFNRVLTTPAATKVGRYDYSAEQYLVDLANNGVTRTADGTSYEILGTMADVDGSGRSIGLKKTQASVNSKTIKFYTAARGQKPGQSNILLFLDADDHASGSGSTHENWPDKEDPHGASGTCMNFTDGHARWIRKVDYLNVKNLSQDGNDPGPDQ